MASNHLQQFDYHQLTHYAGKADKSLDWLDTWKQMEKIYETQRDKVKAIGTHTLNHLCLDL